LNEIFSVETDIDITKLARISLKVRIQAELAWINVSGAAVTQLTAKLEGMTFFACRIDRLDFGTAALGGGETMIEWLVLLLFTAARRLTRWRADHDRSLGGRAPQQQRPRISPPYGLRNPRRSLALTGCSRKLKTASRHPASEFAE
jgi:hypothetical protein